MEVKYINHMGDDLTVVNAARVSFDKESAWEEKQVVDPGMVGVYTTNKLSEKDEKLIRYLANHKHWTPFAHCTITFRIKTPIFVARQLFKHQIGLVVNEVSRRYVTHEPEFYMPDEWRLAAENVKQGSSDYILEDNEETIKKVEEFNKKCLEMYETLLNKNVCPEQARMVLPQSMMTEYYWTGSLIAFARICTQRLEKTAQKETADIALKISDHCSRLFPISWKYLI